MQMNSLQQSISAGMGDGLGNPKPKNEEAELQRMCEEFGQLLRARLDIAHDGNPGHFRDWL